METSTTDNRCENGNGNAHLFNLSKSGAEISFYDIQSWKRLADTVAKYHADVNALKKMLN